MGNPVTMVPTKGVLGVGVGGGSGGGGTGVSVGGAGGGAGLGVLVGLGVFVGGTSGVSVAGAGVLVGGVCGVGVAVGVLVTGGEGVGLAVTVNVGRRVDVAVGVGVSGPFTIRRPTEQPSTLSITSQMTAITTSLRYCLIWLIKPLDSRSKNTNLALQPNKVPRRIIFSVATKPFPGVDRHSLYRCVYPKVAACSG